MKKQNNNILLAIFVCLLFTISYNTLHSSGKYGEFISVEYPNDNRVYFGAIRQNDSSLKNFLFKNFNPKFPLVNILGNHPTYIIASTTSSQSSDDMYMFQLHSHERGNWILLDENNPIDNLTLKFVARASDPRGRKEARLVLGFVTPSDTVTVLQLDTFFFIGKYTNLAIDGYDDFVFFDSVFLNQTHPIKMEWRARNTTNEHLEAIGQHFAYQGNEFNVEEKSYPLTFYAGDNTNFRSWNFYYNPLDTQADTAEFRLLFNSFPGNPDIIDTAKVRLVGVGVRHSLEVADTAGCAVFFDSSDNKIDTIDFGEVRVGHQKTGRVALRNTGTINYGVKNQVIYDEIMDEAVDYFSVQRAMCSIVPNLQVSDNDFFEIAFAPTRRGKFSARYVLENNFKARRIKSNNPSDYKKVYILRGVGVEPDLRVAAASVDFGNVSYANASDCPTVKDTTITLLNVGNSELIISNIATDNIAFSVSPTATSIPANSITTVRVTFLSSAPEQNFSGNLFFETNESQANADTVRLFGSSILPIEAELVIPLLSNKPGSLLSVPIFLTSTDNIRNNISTYGNSYELHLRYNSTMLSYANSITFNTASEGCIPTVTQLDDGLLVSARKDFSPFLSHSTLLILQFRTYIGTNDATEIALVSAKIGNNNCDDFMKLNIQNGRYSIDSICGLPYKLNDISGLSYSFELISQDINSSDIDFTFTLPFETDAQISIFNTLGNEILHERYLQLSNGTFLKSLHLNLHSGVYYFVFSSGLYRKMIPLILNRK